MGSSLEKILASFGSERRINYSLERFQSALRAIGNPEKSAQTLIVSGTNGKGTTALLLSSALVHHGFKVGTYLSPHLQSVTERFLLNLVPIDETKLGALAQEFHPVAERFSLSYFEFLTLLNFIWASDERVDYLVLEVGLGGRLDATNVTRPLACGLTNIAFDHQSYLGNTLPEILNEKLGVLPKGGRLFTSLSDPALFPKVFAHCGEQSATLYETRTLLKEALRSDWQNQTFSLDGNLFTLGNPSAGNLENAALAFIMLRELFPEIPISTLQKAFSSLKIPGRMETVSKNPHVVLSGDHNPAGVQNLLASLEEVEASHLHVLCAFSPDKPYRELYQTLKQISDAITLTVIPHFSEQMPADYFLLGPLIHDPKLAVESILNEMPRDGILLVTGSLYLVGAVRSLWRERVQFLETPPTVGSRWTRRPDAASPTKSPSAEEAQNLD